MPPKVGEVLFVPALGVGRVTATGVVGSEVVCTVAIEESAVTGHPLRWSAPISQLPARGVRALMPPRGAEVVYDVLRAPPALPKLPPAALHREFVHRIATGDPLLVARVVRDLAAGASAEERALYEQARRLVAQELTAVLGVDRREVEREIDGILGT